MGFFYLIFSQDIKAVENTFLPVYHFGNRLAHGRYRPGSLMSMALSALSRVGDVLGALRG